ncbi:hypothetical protein CLI64_15355 [Nostoc sp. CENA543]|uniref:restriction endonuclease subunit S n=1 Tax=Nostoc sp. CENA543 TaxID=1869241 RepID=UPI000CA0F479|nr:restriction endonuclease subunit S [Nostoc sp. CENA543]AUT01652.1 hypothetical protein CLI64_15355 [Nostoc sp. CENA543]
MSKDLSLVPLREILTKSEEWIDINPTEKYKQVTVKIWGKGVVERNEVSGAEIAATKRLKVHHGQFILSRIDARHGAFGIIPNSLDGAVVTNDFPVFTPNIHKILPQFLDWMSKTKDFIEICKAASEGTTNRVRLKEDKFLSMKIRLPLLEEQRRIVARIEELVGKIEEVRSLRQKAFEETATLVTRSTATILDNDDWEEVPLNKLLRENSLNGLSPRPSETPPGLPILRISAATSQANAIIDEADVKYLEVSEQDALKYKLEPGDLLACRYNGNLHYTGKFALYKAYSGRQHLYPDKLIRFRLDTNNIMPEFACLALNSPKCRKIIESFCATTAGNIGLSAGNLKTVSVPVPPLPEQHRIVAYLDELQTKVDTMKRLREQAIKELDALLPSILDKAFKGEL